MTLLPINILTPRSVQTLFGHRPLLDCFDLGYRNLFQDKPNNFVMAELPLWIVISILFRNINKGVTTINEHNCASINEYICQVTIAQVRFGPAIRKTRLELHRQPSY
jgi:hypothetical protein